LHKEEALKMAEVGKKSTLEADDFELTSDSWRCLKSKHQHLITDTNRLDSGVSLSFRDDSVTSFITGNDDRQQLPPLDDVVMDTAIERLRITDNDTVTSRRLVNSGCPLKQNEELFVQDEDGDTKLHLAIIQPHYEAATWLSVMTSVRCPALLNTQNYEFRQTALHLAVLTNLPSIVRTLVVCGAAVDVRDRNGNTPLHLACRAGKVHCIEALTRPVEATEARQVEGYCHRVGLQGYTPSQHQLPDLNSTDYEGRSYLHLSQMLQSADRLPIIDYLVNNCSADINIQEGKSGYTLLHLSVKQHDEELFSYLLHVASVDWNAMTYSRHTALDIADSLNRCDFTARLLTVGAKHSPSYITNDSSSDTDTDEQMDDDFDDLVVAGQRLNINST
jgi:NF-kappa-B inhibitor alpha